MLKCESWIKVHTLICCCFKCIWTLFEQTIHSNIIPNTASVDACPMLCVCVCVKVGKSGGWFNIKMPSYRYRKSHCGDKTILRPSYLHNGISYTGKTTSLYWIRALSCDSEEWLMLKTWVHPLNLRAIRSVVCLKMHGNCSTNQRQWNGKNSVEHDQKLIRPRESHI